MRDIDTQYTYLFVEELTLRCELRQPVSRPRQAVAASKLEEPSTIFQRRPNTNDNKKTAECSRSRSQTPARENRDIGNKQNTHERDAIHKSRLTARRERENGRETNAMKIKNENNERKYQENATARLV